MRTVTGRDLSQLTETEQSSGGRERSLSVHPRPATPIKISEIEFTGVFGVVDIQEKPANNGVSAVDWPIMIPLL